MTSCPCCSGLDYDACCGPLLAGETVPQTAEALMRSRFTAYVKGRVDHLTHSLHPEHRDDHDEEATRRWAARADWLNLQVVSVQGGGVGDDSGEVEFIATYREKGVIQHHHEIGSFSKQDGVWYFIDGKLVPAKTATHTGPKVGRNAPCPCGSGRKYKKCCGR